MSRIINHFILCLLLITNVAVSNSQTPEELTKKVFLIGEDGGAYERLIASCPDMLLSVAGNSMDEAFGLWAGMLSDMQEFSEEEGFDLKGVKIWINVFWMEDGVIDKIVFYPKPTSRNIDFELLTAFLDTFAQSYVLPTEHVRCFSHYGSASFPVFMNDNSQAKN